MTGLKTESVTAHNFICIRSIAKHAFHDDRQNRPNYSEINDFCMGEFSRSDESPIPPRDWSITHNRVLKEH